MTAHGGVVLLVGCTARKLPTTSAAVDLYSPSQLFRARVGYARSTLLPWRILSALHGLLDPREQVDPYDRTMAATMADDVDRRVWCNLLRRSVTGLHQQFSDHGFRGPITLVVHAGRTYVEAVQAATKPCLAPVRIVAPMVGMAIGQQLQWYRQQRDATCAACGGALFATDPYRQGNPCTCGSLFDTDPYRLAIQTAQAAQ